MRNRVLVRKLSYMLQLLRTHPFTREKFGRALVRFAAWHIGSWLVDGGIVVPFANGTRLLVNRGAHSATGVYFVGFQEFSDMAFVAHLLRPGDLFIDVGANVGTYTILAAGVAGARVIAFEPIPQVLADLATNVRLNDIAHLVDIRMTCVGDRTGTARMTVAEGTTNHVISDEQDKGPGPTIEVPIEPLDDSLGDQVPFALKIDVEGFEAAVIRGAHRVLAAPALKAVIVETLELGRRYGANDADIDKQLQSLGFAPFRYQPFTRQLVPRTKPNERSIVYEMHNTLYLRDVPAIQQRVTTAKLISVRDHQV